MQINNFRTDLSDISAKTASLVAICVQGLKAEHGERVGLLQ